MNPLLPRGSEKLNQYIPPKNNDNTKAGGNKAKVLPLSDHLNFVDFFIRDFGEFQSIFNKNKITFYVFNG